MSLRLIIKVSLIHSRLFFQHQARRFIKEITRLPDFSRLSQGNHYLQVIGCI